jgi:hypothetical protein
MGRLADAAAASRVRNCGHSSLSEQTMSQTPQFHHGQAAYHHESATRHHRAAENAYGSGDHKTAAHEAQVAAGHASLAKENADLASKAHMAHHGMHPETAKG